ncbi:MAG: hypothetical protein WHU54_08055 [Candidatus Bathyarchaeia archaeon]
MTTAKIITTKGSAAMATAEFGQKLTKTLKRKQQQPVPSYLAHIRNSLQKPIEGELGQRETSWLLTQ